MYLFIIVFHIVVEKGGVICGISVNNSCGNRCGKVLYSDVI